MKPNVSTNSFHRMLVKELFDRPPTKRQARDLMLLLHASRIVLSSEAKVEGATKGFQGITTRHAAEVVASLFPSGEKKDPSFWYFLWNGDWNAYGILENPTPDDLRGFKEMQRRFESHPWVEKLENDDWEILDNSDSPLTDEAIDD
jgi:hypothetical protein